MRSKPFAAIALVVAFVVSVAIPTRANPASPTPPAICDTGAGCLWLGVAGIGGITYYIWEDNQTGGRHYSPIEKPEEVVSEWDEPIITASPEEADRECRGRARQYGVSRARVQQPSRIRSGQNQQYRCWFS
ncbi:hypothetical protein H6F93_31985 [Leptolyngbya sp. FACHB-671]|uniref:hypothetical protein n=1 Tax=Leptolyngbya sp. FACHB-671 TaxID=2692812 RepID=UPI001684203C|nr:hypothetical protein [Leptolyngbya sp. FACHB-671]MBD2072090.1 hypothetical protein [Leptolyngbya sp. FACHB-671]